MTSHAQKPTLVEQLSSREILLLSPHMDDAMLSASSVVLDHPCEVWTVFTGAPQPPQTTSWDLSCGFADSDATIAARKKEDARAFAGSPARMRHLDALEGAYATREQHRAALPAIEMEIDAWMSAHPDGLVIAPACAGLHMPPPVWEPVAAGVRTLGQNLRARRATLEARDVAPACEMSTSRLSEPGPTPPGRTPSAPRRVAAAVVGGGKGLLQRALHAEHVRRRRRTMGDDGLAANPDHLALRDATLRVAARHSGVQIVLVEDLPYLWHARGDDEVARVERSWGLRAHRVEVPVDVERKHAHLRAYASQLPVLDRRGRLLHPSHLPDHEVFWLLAPR